MVLIETILNKLKKEDSNESSKIIHHCQKEVKTHEISNKNYIKVQEINTIWQIRFLKKETKVFNSYYQQSAIDNNIRIWDASK